MMRRIACIVTAFATVQAEIMLKVKSQDGNEVFFKLKLGTPFRKVMIAYCRKTGTTTTDDPQPMRCSHALFSC